MLPGDRAAACCVAFVAREPRRRDRTATAMRDDCSMAALRVSNDVSRWCSFRSAGRRSQGPSPGRRSAARSCRPRPRRARPRATCARGAEAADDQRCRRLRCRPRSARRRRCASSCVSSVSARACALGRVKCTISSEPSASRSSTVAAQRGGRPARRRRARPPRGARAGCRGSPVGPRSRASAGCVGEARRVELERLLAAERRRDRLPFCAGDRRLEHVHRGRADEAADEEVDRPVVERPAGRRPAGARPCA